MKKIVIIKETKSWWEKVSQNTTIALIGDRCEVEKRLKLIEKMYFTENMPLSKWAPADYTAGKIYPGMVDEIVYCHNDNNLNNTDNFVDIMRQNGEKIMSHCCDSFHGSMEVDEYYYNGYHLVLYNSFGNDDPKDNEFGYIVVKDNNKQSVINNISGKYSRVNIKKYWNVVYDDRESVAQ